MTQPGLFSRESTSYVMPHKAKLSFLRFPPGCCSRDSQHLANWLVRGSQASRVQGGYLQQGWTWLLWEQNSLVNFPVLIKRQHAHYLIPRGLWFTLDTECKQDRTWRRYLNSNSSEFSAPPRAAHSNMRSFNLLFQFVTTFYFSCRNRRPTRSASTQAPVARAPCRWQSPPGKTSPRVPRTWSNGRRSTATAQSLPTPTPPWPTASKFDSESRVSERNSLLSVTAEKGKSSVWKTELALKAASCSPAQKFS